MSSKTSSEGDEGDGQVVGGVRAVKARVSERGARYEVP